jgi:hypothetical protein
MEEGLGKTKDIGAEANSDEVDGVEKTKKRTFEVGEVMGG